MNADHSQAAQEYSPDIRQLAYAMENMSHTERCEAILSLANEQHDTGMKNGRFGYVSEAEATRREREAQERLLDDIASLKPVTEEKGSKMTHIQSLLHNWGWCPNARVTGKCRGRCGWELQ